MSLASAETIVRALERIAPALARAETYAVDDDDDGVVDDFALVKTTFFRRAVEEHPDKGGDASAFAGLYESCVRNVTRLVRAITDGVARCARGGRYRRVREAVRGGAAISASIRDATGEKSEETMRKGSTRKGRKQKKGKAMKALAPELMGDRETIPPRVFFEMMREMDVVGYRIELAASGRSRCTCAENDPNGVAYCRNVSVGSEMVTVKRAKSERGKKDASTGREIEAAAATFGRIAKRAIRIAILDRESGSFGRFRHLNCWRVPKVVWFCMPEPNFCREDEYTVEEYVRRLSQMDDVVFCGFGDLTDTDKNIVAAHVMETSMWASYNEKKYVAARDAGFPSIKAAEKELLLPSTVTREAIESGDAAKESLAVAVAEETRQAQAEIAAAHLLGMSVKRRAKKKAVKPPEVVIPVPNVDGAIANSLTICRSDDTLKPLTFVLTGIFPELDRESFGLAQGKEKAKEFIERFGGVVRSAMSGRTDMLLVGREPGVRKLAEARSRNVTLLNLEHLIDLVHGRSIMKKQIKIYSFSTGFYGTGLAVKMTADELNELRRSHGALPAPSKPEPSPLLPSSSKKIALPSTATTSESKAEKRAAASEETAKRASKRSKRLALAA